MSNSQYRLIIILLVVSVAINLLLVGGIIGRVLSDGPRPPMPDHLGWMVRSLDAETRAELRPRFEAHFDQARPLRRAVREAQREFERLATEESVDPTALAAALKNLRDATGAYQALTHEELVDILKTLPAAQRRSILESIRRPRGGHHDGPRAGPPPP